MVISVLIRRYFAVLKKSWGYLRLKPSLVALAVLVALMSACMRDFATARNFMSILQQVSILGIVSCGLMYVVLCGHIDLSVGAFASFGGVLFARLISADYAGINPALAMLVVILACVAMGLFKAFLTILCKMPSVIATLGVTMIMNGVNNLLADTKIISRLNESVILSGQSGLGTMPWMVLLFLLIAAVSGFVLRMTYLGRYIYAIGANSKAARLAGIHVNHVQFTAFAVCTALAGFGGILLCCSAGVGQATAAGDTYLYNAFTVCAVGGISFHGGKGAMINLLSGVLLLGVITNGMTMLGINACWYDIVQGSVLIISVVIDYMMRNHINLENAVRKLRGASGINIQ